MFNQAMKDIGWLLDGCETSQLHNSDDAWTRPNPFTELVIGELRGIAIEL